MTTPLSSFVQHIMSEIDSISRPDAYQRYELLELSVEVAFQFEQSSDASGKIDLKFFALGSGERATESTVHKAMLKFKPHGFTPIMESE